MNKLLQKLPAIGITTLLRCYFSVPLVVIFFLSGGGWVLPGVMLLGSLIVLQSPFYLLIRLLVPHSMQIEESTLAVVAESRPSYRFVLGSDLQRDGMFLN